MKGSQLPRKAHARANDTGRHRHGQIQRASEPGVSGDMQEQGIQASVDTLSPEDSAAQGKHEKLLG